MDKHGVFSSLVLLVTGGIFFVGSFSYPFGELNRPGPGFLPRIAATILIFVSLLILSDSLRKGHEKDKKLFAKKEDAKLVFLAAASLLAYRLLFPLIGFAPTNFLFFLLVPLTIGGFRWKTSFLFSLVTTVAAYLLFEIILEIQMPIGIFKI